MDAGHRRHAGALQHHDRQLGRPGRSLEQACGFHVADADGAPYVQEADLVLVCKKRYWNDLDPAHMDPEALEHYQAQDYHRMYLGEITQVLRRV